MRVVTNTQLQSTLVFKNLDGVDRTLDRVDRLGNTPHHLFAGSCVLDVRGNILFVADGNGVLRET